MAGPANAERFVNYVTGDPIALGDTNSSGFGPGYPGLVPAPSDPVDPSLFLSQAGWATVAVGTGQCYMSLSGANLLLAPFNGNKVIIDSTSQTIPDAGVTLAPTSLAVSTTFYIYVFMNAGVMTLEASTTAYSIQAGTGIPIKTGDATRSLVGLARTTAVPAWVDSDGSLFVLSWFNRKLKRTQTSFSTNRTSVSTSFAEINSEIRNSFLVWTGDSVQFWCPGSVGTSAGGNFNTTAIGFNGTSPEPETSTYQTFTNNTRGSSYFAGIKLGLTEGLNYGTLLGEVSGSTGTWFSSTSTTSSNTLVVLGVLG